MIERFTQLLQPVQACSCGHLVRLPTLDCFGIQKGSVMESADAGKRVKEQGSWVVGRQSRKDAGTL